MSTEDDKRMTAKNLEDTEGVERLRQMRAAISALEEAAFRTPAFQAAADQFARGVRLMGYAEEAAGESSQSRTSGSAAHCLADEA